MAGSLIAGALGVGSAIIGAKGAKDAASAEAAGIASQIAFQREALAQARSDTAPFRQVGVGALTDLADIFGIQRPGEGVNKQEQLRSSPTRQRLLEFEGLVRGFNKETQGNVPTYQQFLASRPDLHGGGEEVFDRAANAYIDEFGGQVLPSQAAITDDVLKERQANALNKFTEFPGFQFRLQEGQKAQDRSAAARGLLLSGRQVKETERFGQGLASQEFNNFLNGKFALAGIGQNAVNTTIQAGQNSANQIGNALANQGAARASGIAGRTNALTSGLSGLGQSIGFGLGNSGGFGFPGTTGPIIPNQLSFFG